MYIRFLKALNGDCILISFQDGDVSRNILIDGGPPKTFHHQPRRQKMQDGDLKNIVSEIKNKGEKIDLLILTHVDDDHIGGLLRWFKNDPDFHKLITQVWFNSGKLIFEYFKREEIVSNQLAIRPVSGTDTSISQGITFEKIILEKEIWKRSLVHQGQCLDFYGLTFKILSPALSNLEKLLFKWEKESKGQDTARKNDYSKSIADHLADDIPDEDEAVHNGSSIAFLLIYKKRNMLFLADAHPSVVVNGLTALNYSKENPLEAEFVKISHHGSKMNTSKALLELINTLDFIISSNGDQHSLPDKQCLARIINNKNNPNLLFNYPEKINEIFTDEDRNAYSFRTGSVEEGLTINAQL